MQSLTIAAARKNLPCSPAILITRQGWEIGLRIGRCLIVKDECIVKRFSQKRKLKTELIEWPGGGPGESVEACDGLRVLLRTPGEACSSMKLEDVIERDSSDTVFIGTSVPIKLLFDFLEDDQTMDTFLDQFPTVSRDQARAVLGASRDMLLSTASSEI